MQAQPQNKRPSAGRPQQAASRRTPRKSINIAGKAWVRPAVWIAAAALVLVAAYVMQFVIWPDGRLLGVEMQTDHDVAKIMSGSNILINEVMSANTVTVLDEEGDAPDWVEIANVGNSAIDITGYTIAKNADSNAQFTFPTQVLEPGECALIFCDSRLRNAEGGEYHAPFRLSSTGDTLLLFNAGGTAIDTVNIPALQQDVAYRRTGRDAWETAAESTPGLSNTEESYRSLTEVLVTDAIEITEIMASNTTCAPDEDGRCHDYIEIHNTSAETVNLRGYRLSDDRGRTAKWQFPDVTIGPDEYMIIHASGLDRRDVGLPLHTGFKLSSSGESVVLSNSKGQLIDAVDYPSLEAEQAYSRQADGSWTTAGAPTPGAAN